MRAKRTLVYDDVGERLTVQRGGARLHRDDPLGRFSSVFRGDHRESHGSAVG